MHAGLAAQIHHREEQVAELALESRVLGSSYGTPCVELARAAAISARPHATLLRLSGSARRTSGQSNPTPAARSCSRKRAVQRRQADRQSVDDARAASSPSSAPTARVAPSPYSCGWRAFIFATKPLRHVVHRERAALLGDDRVEEHLQQQVAELLAHCRVVAGANRVVDLVASSIRYGRSDSCVCAASHSQRARRSRMSASVSSSDGFACIASSGPVYYPPCGIHRVNAQLEQTRAWVDVDLGALLRNGAAIARRTRRSRCSRWSRPTRYGLGARARRAHARATRSRGASASPPSPKARSCDGRRSRARSSCSRRCLPGDFDAARTRRPHADARRRATRSRAGSERRRPVASRDRHRDESRRRAVGSRSATLRDLLVRDRAAGRVHALPLRRARRRHRATSRSGASTRRSRAAARARDAPRREQRRRSSIAARRAWSVVRPGVFLYGVSSGNAPAIAARSRSCRCARASSICATIADGETVSYGGTWRADGDRRDRHARHRLCRRLSPRARQSGERAAARQARARRRHGDDGHDDGRRHGSLVRDRRRRDADRRRRRDRDRRRRSSPPPADSAPTSCSRAFADGSRAATSTPTDKR